jgi:hypothetical protein
MLQLTESGGAITLSVRVVPRASRTEIAGEHDGALRVRLAAPPVGGAANEELARFIAKSLKVSAREVEIVGGRASKSKRLRVRGATRAAVEALALVGRG